MTTKTIREDAVEHNGRYIVPTIYGTGDPSRDTIWIDTWAAFKACGGVTCWSEDQTEIELTLPVRHKFSIQFMRNENAPQPLEQTIAECNELTELMRLAEAIRDRVRELGARIDEPHGSA